MLRILVLTVLLLCTAIVANSKNHLIISDIKNQKQYVLRKGTRIEFQKMGEGIRYKGKITAIESNAVEIDDQKIPIDEIEMIRAKTFSKGLRVAAATTAVMGLTSAAINVSSGLYYYMYRTLPLRILFGGSLLFTLIKKRTFYRSDSIRFDIVERRQML